MACGKDPKFTRLGGRDLGRTLSAKLAPVVDRLRDIRVRLGQRPYRVRIIRVRAAGSTRGVGSTFVSYEQEILPTPKITDLTALTEIVTAVGVDEVGSILLSEVSPRYTEDNLRGLDQDGNPPEPNEQVFYEIEFPRLDGREGERRRFTLRSAPTFRPDRFEWEVRLERARADRTRRGGLP